MLIAALWSRSSESPQPHSTQRSESVRCSKRAPQSEQVFDVEARLARTTSRPALSGDHWLSTVPHLVVQGCDPRFVFVCQIGREVALPSNHPGVAQQFLE